MTTIESITDGQISELRQAAGEHGDLEMVAICDRALGNDADALEQCVDAIRAGEDMAEEPWFDIGGGAA